MRFLLNVIICICFASCIQQKDKEEDNRAIVFKEGLSIEVVDTIQCEIVDNLAIVGRDIYKDSLIVILNPLSGNIRIVNFYGKVIKDFKRSGYDNLGFGQYLGGVTFLNDGSLMVLSDLGFYNYSIDGDLKSYFRHSNEIEMAGGLFVSGQLNLQQIETSNSQVIGFVSMINLINTSGVNQKEFYSEVRLLNKVEYPSYNYQQFLEYPDKGIYKQTNGYYHNHYPLFSLTNNKILNVIYNLEGIIYQYDIESMKLVSTLDIEPDNFTTCSPFDFGTSSNDYVVTLKSDYYTNIFSSGDTLLLTYTKWLDDNNELQSVSDINSKGYLHKKYYLQILIQSTREIFEIELPKHYPYLQAVSNGKLLLQQEVHHLETEPNTENILVVKLKFPI